MPVVDFIYIHHYMYPKTPCLALHLLTINPTSAVTGYVCRVGLRCSSSLPVGGSGSTPALLAFAADAGAFASLSGQASGGRAVAVRQPGEGGYRGVRGRPWRDPRGLWKRSGL